MGDMGDTFNALRAHRQEKRANNRADSPRMLAEAGINIASINNGGAHVIVDHGGHIVDFWPGTGLWIKRGTKKRQYGVRNLIKFCLEPHHDHP